ncbi:MAG: hypothetical protein EP349_09885 [Alphaproteobacteria bacterium]|nr:MAG: hypothetical protein EP349_09885 [Alphaproteobacteria bacterium]
MRKRRRKKRGKKPRNDWGIKRIEHLDKTLIFSFFEKFSKFECALKRAGFHKGDEDKIEVAWDKFANSLNSDFVQKLGAAEECTAIFKNPPKKMVVRNGNAGWKPEGNECPASPNDNQTLFVYVRRVRNNLFHGGKYPEGPVQTPERDGQLLKSCMYILEKALEQSSKVNEFYRQIE